MREIRSTIGDFPQIQKEKAALRGAAKNPNDDCNLAR
jgi:hypothetical protein